MSFFKTHLPPTLHNAAGTLLASAVLAVLTGSIVFIKAFRDFPVPLWVAFIFFIASVIFVLALFRKLSKKQTYLERTTGEIAALKTEIARLKDQIPIPRRPGESEVDYTVRITTNNDRNA